MKATDSTSNGSRLTVAVLAKAKRLPLDFLRSPAVGLSDLPGGGVAIPYYDMTGAEQLFVRERESPRHHGKKFYQPCGVSVRAYGQWRLHEAQNAGCVF